MQAYVELLNDVEKSGEDDGRITWLGENGEFVGILMCHKDTSRG